MAKITVRPTMDVIEADQEVSLLENLKRADIYVKSSCGGHATCTDCIVKIVSGEDHLSAPPFEELKLLGNVFHITKERLACQTKISGDVCIDLSAHDKARDQKKLRQKTGAPKRPLVRKKADVDALKSSREQEAERERAERPPRQGGFRRPKKR